MSTMPSQITSLTIIYSAFYSGVGQRKHQSSASLAFVRGIHRSRHRNDTKERELKSRSVPAPRAFIHPFETVSIVKIDMVVIWISAYYRMDSISIYHTVETN